MTVLPESVVSLPTTNYTPHRLQSDDRYYESIAIRPLPRVAERASHRHGFGHGHRLPAQQPVERIAQPILQTRVLLPVTVHRTVIAQAPPLVEDKHLGGT